MNIKAQTGISLVANLVVAGIAILVLVAIIYGAISILIPDEVSPKVKNGFNYLVDSFEDLKSGESNSISFQLDENYLLSFFDRESRGKQDYYIHKEKVVLEGSGFIDNKICPGSSGVCIYKKILFNSRIPRPDISSTFNNPPLLCHCFKNYNSIELENKNEDWRNGLRFARGSTLFYISQHKINIFNISNEENTLKIKIVK